MRPARGRAPMYAAIALAGALAAGGTVAFLIDGTEGIANTFQPTEVTCTVDEDFDGSVKSNVRVENTGDVEAYVRVAVVANWVKEGAAGNSEVLGVAPVEGVDYSLGTLGASWILGADGYYYCKTKVPAAAEGGSFTPVLFDECRQIAEGPEGYVLSLDIIASAIQAEPDGAVESAWGVSVSESDGVKTISKA